MSGSEGNVDRRSAIVALAGLVLTVCGTNQTAKGKPSGSSAASPSVSPTSAANPTALTPAPSSASPAIVSGANSHYTRERLGAHADRYAGRWVGAWSEPAVDLLGEVEIDASIDPDARTFAVVLRLDSDLFPGLALPPFRTVIHADEFVYDDTTGDFHIERDTPLGHLVLTSDQGIGTGTFQLKIDQIPRVAGLSRIEASGVAFRPDEVPVDFTVHFADGFKSNGRLTFARPT